MAWMSSGTSNADLVANLWKHGLITEPQVRDAFLKVDRAHYAPTAPYQDSPQCIGHAATISAPHIHACAVEKLLPFLLPPSPSPSRSPSPSSSPSPSAEPSGPQEKKERGGRRRRRRRRVLDVGSGSGYLTHVLAELVGPGGTVVGVEHVPQLQALGVANMRKSAGGRALLDSGRVRFRVGDGRKGWVEPNEPTEPTNEHEDDDGVGDEGRGGWDAIHVGASAVTLHQELVDQLRAPGRMFIPVDDDEVGGRFGNDGQHVWAVDKDAEGRVTKKKLFAVRYVPLTDGPRN